MQTTMTDALRTFSDVQAQLAEAACMLLDFAADKGDAMTATAETITDRQIRNLREEAMAASDYLQADICDVALASEEDGHEVGSGRTRTTMTRTEARAECARVIADAEAQ